MKRIILLAAAMLLGAVNSFASGVIGFDPKLLPPVEKVKLLSNEEFFSMSDFIIEGRAIGQSYSYDANRNYIYNNERRNIDRHNIYTCTLFRVSYVYKNNSNIRISGGDTLRIISKGGVVYKTTEGDGPFNNFELINSRGAELTNPGFGNEEEPLNVGGQPTIYFFKKNVLPEDSLVKKLSTRYIEVSLEDSIVKNYHKHMRVNHLQDVPGAAISLPNEYARRGSIAGLNELHFENLYELYKYMEQFEGVNVNVPLSDSEKMRWYLDDETFNQYLKERNVKWLDSNDPQVRDSLNRIREMRLQRARENSEKKKREQGLLRSSTGNNILNVSIQNQKVRYDHSTQKYSFYFDVYVNANSFLTYLDYAVLRLYYNTTAFGTNIKTNGKVTITKGAIFNTSTYSVDVNDISSNILDIGIGAAAVNPVRTLLTTDTVKLLNVEIELPNGLTGVSSGINFTDVFYTSTFSFFTPASNTPVYDTETYDATNYYNPPGFTIYTVAPTLSNFTPTTAHAGIGEIITINGNNFGTAKGQVLFTKGGIVSGATDYLNGLDTSYIESWTNTQIEVKVPSFVRKGYLPAGVGNGAGSGKIKVRTARNDSVISASSLNIEYSLRNRANGTIPDSNPICRVYLARLSTCKDIVFTLHTTFQGSSKANARNAVETALQEWSALLGISLVLEKNSANTDYEYASGFSDTKNVIAFSPVDHEGNNFLGMSTVPRIRRDSTINHNCAPKYTFYRGYGSHIYIQDNPVAPWVYQTSGTVYQNTMSFYNAILHEIGHVLGLHHVNNLGDLMYYAIDVSQNYTVTNLTSTSKPVVGAATTVAESRNITWKASNIGTLGTLGPHCGSTGFYDMVIIQDPAPGNFDYQGNPLLPNTYIIEPCSQANFCAGFSTGSTPPTYDVAYDWSVFLYRSDGTEYVYAQQTGMSPNTYYNYTQGCHWQFSAGSLPAYDWLYDSSGNIYGIVKVVVHINDGDIKSDQTDIGVALVKNIDGVIYSTNTTINACSDIKLTNVKIQGTPTVTFNMNGHEIIMDETFDASLGSTFIFNP